MYVDVVNTTQSGEGKTLTLYALNAYTESIKAMNTVCMIIPVISIKNTKDIVPV